jgi:hypothetical protein
MTKKLLFSVALLGLGLRSIFGFVYTFYTKIHNIAERIILPYIFCIFYLLLSKVFVFLCRKCRQRPLAQAYTGYIYFWALCRKCRKYAVSLTGIGYIAYSNKLDTIN